ncbi:MAG: type II toxin-antitoxin system Phd/YefM family antitoxin [Gemmatimonadota bacterium]
MASVPVSEAKNNLSALLREVRGGAIITITDRGVPVARLIGPPSTRGVSAAAIDLAQHGRLVLPDRPPGTKWLSEPRPKPRDGCSGVRALLDERRNAR